MSENTGVVEASTETEQSTVNFDPKQVEAELVRIAQERAEDPAEVAAQTYRVYLPCLS